MYSLNICHLYPDLLNMYGDKGNILVLQKRCLWRNIEVNIIPVSLAEDIVPSFFDIFFIGGGQDFEQEIIRDDLLEIKGESIIREIENDRVFLAICGGYQLLGKYYLTCAGKKLDFLGAIDIHTIADDKRMIGNILFECDFLKNGGSEGKMVGFENHSGKTYLGPQVKPLGKVIKGFGNNGSDGFEGARYRNVYCTYCHGSFLPRNPEFADMLILKALENKYGDVSLPDLDDTHEYAGKKRMMEKILK